MAIKTWAALAGNELVAHAEVENAVATGQLLWRGSNPGLAAGYCYTRADFENYIEHSSMSSSGIAAGECMSKSEMETYRVLAPAITSATAASEWLLEGASWRGWLVFGVNALTLSVKVERSVNGGPFALVNNQNVTPGGSNISTTKIVVDAGDTLQIRITPYTGASATGAAGTPIVRDVSEPA